MTGAPPIPKIPAITEQSTHHATCVTAFGKGVLIIGSSGSGKSSLALALMGYGAKLVADDRVIITKHSNNVVATAPTAIKGLIEARGIGLLHAKTESQVGIDLVIDLSVIELERLPPNRNICVLGQNLPLLYKVETSHFPAAIIQYLACGRQQE